jgi:hypothetical protein
LQYKPSHKRWRKQRRVNKGPAMKRMFIFLVLAVLATALVASGSWLRQAIAVDRCLDRGGAWNHEADACLGARD